MKYCKAPFQQMYIDFNGNVRFCGWTNGEPIGNIIEQDLEEIWTSDRAYQVRDKILKGNFDYCRADICPYIMGGTLPDGPVTFDKVYKELPEKYELSYDYVCNLSCPSCRKRPILGSQRSDAFFNKINEKLRPYLNKAQTLTFGGHGDPIYSKHSFSLLKNLQPERDDCHLIIQTNGQCLTRDAWSEIKHLSKYRLSLIISIDSLNPHVYAKLRRGGNLATLLKNIKFISSLREYGSINALSAVMVVQDLNFMEIPSFTEFCFRNHFDGVELENLYNWGTFTDKEYFSKNLLNPEHPNHKFFKQILTKALKDPRVHCWAGETNRVVNKWLVTHQSPYGACSIEPGDCIDVHSSLDMLSNSLWNRDYIFVIDKGQYRGTIIYSDFHNFMSKLDCHHSDISHLINPSIVPVEYEHLSAILGGTYKYKSKFPVAPLVENNRLIGKLLIS